MSRSVLLVCDSGLLAETLRDLIGEVEAGIEVRSIAERDPGNIDAALIDAAALVLVDIDYLGAASESALTDLAMRHAVTALVAFGTPEAADLIDRLLAAGLRGYIPKSHGREAFLGVLRMLLSGVRYRPELRADPLAATDATAPWAMTHILSLARDFHLTPAEIAVLRLTATGLTNREIADARERKEGVVRIQLNAVFRKLGVRHRTQAVLVALRCEELIGIGHDDRLDLCDLLGHLSYRRCKAGEILFQCGDLGEEVFIVQRGIVRLPEIGVDMQAHDVFGEIGAFSPGHRRTSCAVCVTDADLFVIPPDAARRFYCLDPRFAVFIRDLLVQHLTADRASATAN